MNTILLHTETKRVVAVGDTLKTFRGEAVIVTGWEKPRHAGSTGRIYVRDAGIPHGLEMSFFPSVCGCEVVEGGAQ